MPLPTSAAPSEAPGNEAGRARVLVRFRPLGPAERPDCCVQHPSSIAVQHTSTDGTTLGFSFDAVLGQGASQAQVFEQVADVVRSTLEGKNGTIMAYGQTGSGKTHTLIGDVKGTGPLKGLLSRAVDELAQGIATLQSQCQFRVLVSVLEIYCERIRDLLACDGVPSSASDNLAIQQDHERGITVVGATEVPVLTEAELVALMQQGIANRKVAATGANAQSSRSHCLMLLAVERLLPDGSCTRGKLCLVDLAGSERQDRTGAEGQVLEESRLINRSLSALGNVICALTDGRSAHIPYRDSKLTRVLQDSLGGRSRMALIVCCSPSADSAAETLSSLRFGCRAKGLVAAVQAGTPGPARQPGAEELAKLLAAARQECEELRQQLEKQKALSGSGAVDASAKGVQSATPWQQDKGALLRLLTWLQITCMLLLVLTHFLM